MNITSKILAITSVAAMSFAGVSYAENMPNRVSVTLVQSVDDNAFKTSLENLSSDEIASAQSTVQADSGLVAALQQKNVQLNNIVKVQKFSDGSASVYLR